jgi:hypothetical protein
LGYKTLRGKLKDVKRNKRKLKEAGRPRRRILITFEASGVVSDPSPLSV